MNQIVVTGMILSSAPVGEYDRRIEILTKERGKIAAFAKGSRRPKSSLVGAVNPFTFGEFTLYAGRSSYTVKSVNVINYFAELRGNVECAYYGFYFLEAASYCTKENSDAREVLKLLYQTLRALLNGNIPRRLIRCIFELRLYCAIGEGPEVSSCVVCRDTDGPFVFSVKRGGILCGSCAKGVGDAAALCKSALYAMRYIEGSTIERLYTFTVSEEVLGQLCRLLDRYRREYVDKEFNSLKILETLP